ncbi:hypothetical protein [Agrobacterium sp. LMR679]|uniref:hypothetical protein n=1 Tax=Agrobacterium sp. LMR679 TaxID=3014335 RepID=UPI0022AEFB14|nr:hypothetical protein [Agrobacterium sp. LMR679]MCZ4076242.1 hypothetical protein [Agrobacterium sp. LMR679]MCZ4076310.1 hypothetical protein [Agrobacterium sp. LMR679]
MVSVNVRSPMQAALNADRIASIANYHDMVMAFAGPEQRELYLNQDKVMERIADGLQIDKDLIPDDAEKEKVLLKIEDARRQQMQAMMAAEMAKQAPGAIKDLAVADMRRAA